MEHEGLSNSCSCFHLYIAADVNCISQNAIINNRVIIIMHMYELSSEVRGTLCKSVKEADLRLEMYRHNTQHLCLLNCTAV